MLTAAIPATDCALVFGTMAQKQGKTKEIQFAVLSKLFETRMSKTFVSTLHEGFFYLHKLDPKDEFFASFPGREQRAN